MENRIVKLEITQEHHQKEIGDLKKMHADMRRELQDFKKILSDIKNWIIGAFGFFLAQQFGLVEILKKIVF